MDTIKNEDWLCKTILHCLKKKNNIGYLTAEETKLNLVVGLGEYKKKTSEAKPICK